MTLIVNGVSFIIGPLTIAFALAKSQQGDSVRYAEENVLIG